MTVTANEYLDARQVAWLDAEVLGHVRYDKTTRTVEIRPVVATVDIVTRLRAMEPRL